jgi:HEPN domain-containing protein
MPLDPVRIEDTKAWFSRAHEDLRAAAIGLEADPPLLEDALFHCQQAAEKAEKGLLA